MPDAPRPFRVPLYPMKPLAYLAIVSWSVIASVLDGGWRAVVSPIVVVAALLLLRPLLSPRAASTP
jgi:uncharacterized membrane protein YjdF